ncbi:MAG: sigma 54-interacting transcriptional regulator [Ignavibacteria bacterium]|nr:sigma 54-interacting transcriptional regulator [Ignavibacteria bacterium]MBI3765903.1 sigma 54-interacting transcriptional regulator [Ignavibacteriales bacterium]
MARINEKFKIMLCGKKDLMESLQKAIVKSREVHLQFTSSPAFLMGRAVFTTPDVVLLDAAIDRSLLQEVLESFRMHYSHVSLFPIATAAHHQDVVDLMKHGATGFYEFPNDYRKLNERLKQLIEEWRMAHSQKRFIQLQQRAYDFNQIIGSSPRLTETLHRAKKVIENPAMTVLITGETGTGKELLARAIHYNSSNSNSPFVDIACSALPEALLESELFGYDKGAFTDAREKKPGLFELAADGSIFLDEIGDISLPMQSKLLKVIESRTMRRLGGLHDIPVKARIIAATSVDLQAKMKAGTFRKDLFHRLKIIPLEVPSLRERKEDIPLFASTFIDLFNRLYNKKISGVSPDALHVLAEHEWEGNIRELKHSIERAVLLKEDGTLERDDFDFMSKSKSDHVPSGRGKNGKGISLSQDDAIILSIPLAEAAMEDVQRKLALRVLDYVGGNKSKAAYILRISRPRLDRILRIAPD